MADRPSVSNPNEEIILFAGENEDVLVWSAEDVHTLRTKYRIVGSLIGSLPRKPKQNVCLSLPLLLSKEETTLLLRKKFARLVKNEANSASPSQEEIEEFKIAREESTRGQILLFLEENKEKEKEFADSIEAGKGKKKKRDRKRQRKKEDESCNLKPSKIAKTEEENLADNENVDKMMSGTIDSSKNIESNNESTAGKGLDMDVNELRFEKNFSTVVEPMEKDLIKDESLKMSEKEQETCSSVTLENRTCNSIQDTQMEQACVIHIPTRMSKTKTKDFCSQEWHYPQTETEKLRYQVFLDLWEKGFYITPASKFGGDFLAYPGDPFKFHSFYVVIVIPWNKEIGMLELISIGRLAATVKKTAVLGTVSDKGEVVYSSIKWSGIT